MDTSGMNNENDPNKKEQKEIIQIVFVGPAFVGKTALINR